MSTFCSGFVSEYLIATLQFEVLPTQSCFLLFLLSQVPHLHCGLNALLLTHALFSLPKSFPPIFRTSPLDWVSISQTTGTEKKRISFTTLEKFASVINLLVFF